MEHRFNNRDISWLFFNERVLDQAAKAEVPLLERFKFLSIFSSNLDEFYRVRMPAIKALQQINDEDKGHVLEEVNGIIQRQQKLFGHILSNQLLPLLEKENITFTYRKPIPELLLDKTKALFLNHLSAYLRLIWLSEQPDFFPESNKIYIAFECKRNGLEDILIVNIPADANGRFFSEDINGIQNIVTIDDIIKTHLPVMLAGIEFGSGYSFKMTRDADLDLHDEFKGDLAERIEAQIAIRDFGLATRFLYDGAMPSSMKDKLTAAFQLQAATLVEGGAYHNLKDLAALPLYKSSLSYDRRTAAYFPLPCQSIFDCLDKEDILVSVPYQSYDRVLQFFNACAIDPAVTHIYITLYRIAGDSVIANALISAAKNGKKVTVFVELKARFDEANNIQWSKKMKAAGITIINSIPGLKVHAKVALVKRTVNDRSVFYGVFSTGNFNENTARFYTDHILLTAHKEMLREAEMLFLFLEKRRKPTIDDVIKWNHLLVAQFNLQSEFLRLIQDEIEMAKNGQPAAITIKLNNLEEDMLINKLYEASAAGVKIKLLVRAICRIRGGVQGLSENIEVHRIVDRYLEHPRIFIFHNNDQPKIYLGSADWMNRNIYRRIEVCFPIYNEELQCTLLDLMELQWNDNGSAVMIDENGHNQTLSAGSSLHYSQDEIYHYFKTNNHE